MNLNLHFSHFEQIHKNGYTLDIVFILKLIEDGQDVEQLCKRSEKLSIIYQSVLRKGLITKENNITLSGQAVLDFINSEQDEVKLAKVKSTDDDFLKWWQAYPGTDTFKCSEKSFTGTRSLRVKRDECRVKFNKILDEGEYTCKDMIDALEFEVNQKVNNSIKTNTNKMSFMQNSLTYLNQRTFEPFIELIKSGHSIEEKKPVLGSIDI